MADFPDWTRLFYLSGVAITIPINIESSDIILPVSIDAATATVDVNLTASDITVDINIAGSDITVNVNLHAQTANIDIDFADQSIAVFDAAKWFAHEADQVFIYGSASCISGGVVQTLSYTVPSGKTFFIAFMAAAVSGGGTFHILGRLEQNGSVVFIISGEGGAHAPVDVPFRFTAGQVITFDVANYHTATRTVHGNIGGWLE